MPVKKVVIQDKEIEIYDSSPIDKMRRRDTDGDGVCDFIDSNGYSKPNDKYREIDSDEYKRLKNSGYDVENSCRKSPTNPDKFILRYPENRQSEIDTILKPVLRHSISK